MYHVREHHGPVLGRTEIEGRFPDLDTQSWEEIDRAFPVRVTRSWANRMQSASGPLGRQVLPGESELLFLDDDRPDPVGESLRSPLPWVVHKHPDRVLFLVTRRCHLYCRYCFRRDQHGPSEPSNEETDQAFEYLAASGAKELILSGGDPLTLSNRKLHTLLRRGQELVARVRVHSRTPITFPHRIDEELVRTLHDHGPVWMVVHCNHPKELSDEVCDTLARLVDGGIPVLNQSVLLRGVNDDADLLVELSEALLGLRVQPYYLHHTDPVPGNGDFRVPLQRGLEIHEEMSLRLGGIGLPRYVIDPPDGTGKVDVARWAASMDPTPVP